MISMIGKYKANNKPAPTVQKNPMKYLNLGKSGDLSWVELRPKSTELSVKRITQLRFEKVILCLTMMTEKMRLKTSCDDKRREEVDTGK